ncbi:MAG TPA: VOC family protein, partial [Actinomycetota bacterium]|nr:VOC family protein [Actinomycetota bacterium]
DGYDSWEDWLRAMGIPEDDWNSAGAAVDPDGKGPRLYFQRVPEAKVAKNRVHLDVNVGGGRETPLEERRARVDAEAQRAVSLGARELYRIDERGEFHITLQDPEGNEFCLQ